MSEGNKSSKNEVKKDPAAALPEKKKSVQFGRLLYSRETVSRQQARMEQGKKVAEPLPDDKLKLGISQEDVEKLAPEESSDEEMELDALGEANEAIRIFKKVVGEIRTGQRLAVAAPSGKQVLESHARLIRALGKVKEKMKALGPDAIFDIDMEDLARGLSRAAELLQQDFTAAIEGGHKDMVHKMYETFGKFTKAINKWMGDVDTQKIAKKEEERGRGNHWYKFIQEYDHLTLMIPTQTDKFSVMQRKRMGLPVDEKLVQKKSSFSAAFTGLFTSAPQEAHARSKVRNVQILYKQIKEAGNKKQDITREVLFILPEIEKLKIGARGAALMFPDRHEAWKGMLTELGEIQKKVAKYWLPKISVADAKVVAAPVAAAPPQEEEVLPAPKAP